MGQIGQQFNRWLISNGQFEYCLLNTEHSLVVRPSSNSGWLPSQVILHRLGCHLVLFL